MQVPASQVQKPLSAIPYWLPLFLFPLAAGVAHWGGWTLILLPLSTWWLFSALDALLGQNNDNPDTETPESGLFWYRLVTLIWFPAQFVALYAMIWFATHSGQLTTGEKIALFFGMGIITGTVGIVYAHELLHQKNRLEQWLGDLLLATVLYSHFRSEHLRVHHIWIGTPRDPVTARYNEGFHRYFPRVLLQCRRSAWAAECALLARKGLAWHSRLNPYWRYWALQSGAIALAFAVGGWQGLGLFLVQAFSAVWQLELTNYVEHYGLTRRHLGEGRYEHVRPHHSWNASHTASNWLLINLQRHSDHHYKPHRRFPLLQTYAAEQAPQLPFGYPLMTLAAMIPPLWKRIMNPRVRDWRRRFYPEITDWHPYNKALNPMPQAAGEFTR